MELMQYQLSQTDPIQTLVFHYSRDSMPVRYLCCVCMIVPSVDVVQNG